MFERKLAQSVQRDYLAAAEQHRLLKEIGTQPSTMSVLIKAGVTLATIIGIAMVFSQFLTL